MIHTANPNRRGEHLQQILQNFITRTPDTLIAIAATRSGLTIASVKNGITTAQEDALAVAAARVLDMAATVNNQLEQGSIGRILIEGETQTTIVIGAGHDIALIIALPSDAKLGVAMVSIKNTAEQIAQVYK